MNLGQKPKGLAFLPQFLHLKNRNESYCPVEASLEHPNSGHLCTCCLRSEVVSLDGAGKQQKHGLFCCRPHLKGFPRAHLGLPFLHPSL